MKLSTLLFLLAIGVAAYLVSQAPPELLEQIGIHGGDDAVEVTEEDGGAASDADALAYVQRNVGHACRKQKENRLTCLVKNGGTRDLFSVSIEIGASAAGRESEELYILEVQGPFPAKSNRSEQVEVPMSEPIQWLASRSEIVAAEFDE